MSELWHNWYETLVSIEALATSSLLPWWPRYFARGKSAAISRVRSRLTCECSRVKSKSGETPPGLCGIFTPVDS
jgi:hypothetical protein